MPVEQENLLIQVIFFSITTWYTGNGDGLCQNVYKHHPEFGNELLTARLWHREFLSLPKVYLSDSKMRKSWTVIKYVAAYSLTS